MRRRKRKLNVGRLAAAAGAGAVLGAVAIPKLEKRILVLKSGHKHGWSDRKRDKRHSATGYTVAVKPSARKPGNCRHGYEATSTFAAESPSRISCSSGWGRRIMSYYDSLNEEGYKSPSEMRD